MAALSSAAKKQERLKLRPKQRKVTTIEMINSSRMRQIYRH